MGHPGVAMPYFSRGRFGRSLGGGGGCVFVTYAHDVWCVLFGDESVGCVCLGCAREMTMMNRFIEMNYVDSSK